MNQINEMNQMNETNEMNEINQINETNETNETNEIASLTPERKIRVALDLYESARQLKAAGLRALHPDWTEEKIQQTVREIFLYART